MKTKIKKSTKAVKSSGLSVTVGSALETLELTADVAGQSLGAATLFGDFEGEDILTMDGYDDCIVGVVEQFGRPPIACYDKQKVLVKLQQDGMSEDEADEFWSFNQIGAWVGDGTPCFLTPNDQAQPRCGRTKPMNTILQKTASCANWLGRLVRRVRFSGLGRAFPQR